MARCDSGATTLGMGNWRFEVREVGRCMARCDSGATTLGMGNWRFDLSEQSSETCTAATEGVGDWLLDEPHDVEAAARDVDGETITGKPRCLVAGVERGAVFSLVGGGRFEVSTAIAGAPGVDLIKQATALVISSCCLSTSVR